jgi:drug/metabolite transporter (DMT)-like permease
MAGGRFTTAGLLLFAWCIIKKETIPSLKSIAVNSLAGILMLFVGNTAVVYSEQYLPSGLVAIVVATAPLWFVILDKRQWHFHFSNKIILAGLLVGFAGVLMLLIGSMGWVIGSLYSKYKKSDGSTIVKAAIQMLAGGIVAILAGFISNEQRGFALANVSTTSIVALIYLITLGSLVAFIAYIWLLSVRPPSLVGTYAYVNPVVAVFLGWLIAGEAITSSQVIALSIVLVGVLIVNFSREQKAEQSIGKKERTIDIQNPERSTEINTETSSAHGSV